MFSLESLVEVMESECSSIELFVTTSEFITLLLHASLHFFEEVKCELNSFIVGARVLHVVHL